MDKAKAQELIAEFERHQQEQIRCLQALIGLASENVAKEEPSVSMHRFWSSLVYRWSTSTKFFKLMRHATSTKMMMKKARRRARKRPQTVRPWNMRPKSLMIGLCLGVMLFFVSASKNVNRNLVAEVAYDVVSAIDLPTLLELIRMPRCSRCRPH